MVEGRMIKRTEHRVPSSGLLSFVNLEIAGCARTIAPSVLLSRLIKHRPAPVIVVSLLTYTKARPASKSFGQ